MKQLTPAEVQRVNAALIGFDVILNVLELAAGTNYPPYNIIKYKENQYEIQMAITGFSESEIEVKVENNYLVVTGDHSRDEDEDVVYIHKGLSNRNFSHRFALSEHMEINGALIRDGVLIIRISRIIPESTVSKIIDIVRIS